MTAIYRLILGNNLMGMSNLSEIIEQLKSNQEAFNSKLAKVEDLGTNVSKSVLRDLIQDAREIHEGTVVLSYVLFNEEAQESEQLEIPLEENPLPNIEVVAPATEPEIEANSEEAELMDALDQAIEFTHQEIKEANVTPEIVSEINEVKAIIEEEEEEALFVTMPENNVEVEAPEPVVEPVAEQMENVEEISTQDELTASLESDISSVISMHSNTPVAEEVEEDNSLAAKLARKKIENLNSAIGINEKFLFTNELFDGNTEQFLKTIDDLNNCATLSEANDKLSAVAQKRSWELEEEPFQKLQSLLTRKYQ